jgi:hypothetical protein
MHGVLGNPVVLKFGLVDVDKAGFNFSHKVDLIYGNYFGLASSLC